MNPLQILVYRLQSVLDSSLDQKRTQPQVAKTGLASAEEVRLRIALEHLRQARYSFNLSLVIIAVGAIISFRGANLLLTGKATEGAIAAVSHLLASVCHVQMVREANERLEKSAAALKDEE
jgi:predicted amino acid racemase